MVRKNGLPRRVYERHGAWHFVDLAGDLESARALLGHRTQRMTAHYTRGKHVPKVKPTLRGIGRLQAYFAG